VDSFIIIKIKKQPQMKKTFILTIIGFLICNLTFAQQEKYSELIKEADKFYDTKEYKKSGEKYEAAFVANDNKGSVTDRYNAACSWALANEVEPAFVQMFKIAQKGNYTNLNHMLSDSDLNALHSDKRWEEVVAMVSANKEKEEINFDKPIVAILDQVYQEDQKYRMQIDGIAEKHGYDSDEMAAHWKLINEKDVINLEKVQKILDERGWLGSDVIGKNGNLTLFLVIQHAPIEVQDKYLPMMREAVAKGNANAGSLALLEDRVSLRKGGKQIYGSQVSRNPETEDHYVLPLEDPDNVDARRAEVGLGKLQDYVSRWGINWNPEAYKKQLPAIEALQKK